MSELIHKFGIDWRLLLAQALNFFAVLAILRFTVYKPLVRVLQERRRRIEQGLQDAEAAGEKLATVDRAYKERIAEAEKESLKMMAETEVRGKEKEAQMLQTARGKEAEILKAAEKLSEVKKQEAETRVYAEAAQLVKRAVAKTVELKPELVEDSLVKEALKALKKSSS